MFDMFKEGLTFTNFVDMLIILLLAYLLYIKIRKTEALKIIIGIVIIFFLSHLTGEIGLTTTSEILKKANDLLVLGLVVIFHPELRMGLKKIGGLTDIKNFEETKIIDTVEEAVYMMSSNRIGALILIDYEENVANFSENQTKIDALCTAELLQTIFHPKTRLHDGAVIIHGDRIAYAGCKLPITGRRRKDLGHLGTRHLAALENVERFNAIAVVVSEETGNVSIVTSDGMQRVKSRETFKQFFEDEKQKKIWLEKFIKKS